MRGCVRSWRDGRAALALCAGLAVLSVLSACGGDYSQTPPTALAATAAVSPGATPSPFAEVEVSPALTPSFDAAIHDYVIDCTSSPEIQFTAWLIGQNFFNFFGPGAAVAQPGYPVGGFQKTLALQPGQRFRFSVAEGQEYSVRCLPKDFPPLSIEVGGTEAPQAEWYVFAPAIGAPSSFVILVNAQGTPVWWMNEPGGTAIDAKVLGQHQITWTTETTLGAGGQYVIRDFAGNPQSVITGNLDDHELQETPSGTFLAIRDVPRQCPPDCADMSPWGGSAHAAVIDAEIIELDKNSNVLWTWRTRDHIALSETGESGWFPQAGNDIIHMNAIEPDGTDGLMFSARHLNAIYHVTKSTNAIDWKIGGTARPEQLTVIGDNRPTAIGGQVLSGQHDVRKWSDGTISVHDNGTIANRPPFVIRYQVDTAARTATVLEQLQDVRIAYSGCCGSARRLPGGHWLVDWGEQPLLTELDSSGNPVFTIHYNMGPAFSYRAVPVLPGLISALELREGMDAMVGE